MSSYAKIDLHIIDTSKNFPVVVHGWKVFCIETKKLSFSRVSVAKRTDSIFYMLSVFLLKN